MRDDMIKLTECPLCRGRGTIRDDLTQFNFLCDLCRGTKYFQVKGDKLIRLINNDEYIKFEYGCYISDVDDHKIIISVSVEGTQKLIKCRRSELLFTPVKHMDLWIQGITSDCGSYRVHFIPAKPCELSSEEKEIIANL